MDYPHKFAVELWHIMLELSPWLLFGMIVAGVIHVLLPVGFIKRHLGGNGFWSVLKAVALGIPMPLCSCGVIPAAMGLRRDGASKGATTGFLISTPGTGVESIFVSASMLGLPFAIFRVFADLVIGMVGGIAVNLLDKEKTPAVPGTVPAAPLPEEAAPRNFTEIFRFGLIRMLRDIYRWLVAGILIAALIGVLVPADFLHRYSWTQGIWGMLLALVISLPMYICATASIPLAAALIAAGMSPGAALVLLIAGPASNVATMGAVYKFLGRRVLVIYLVTLAVMSLLMGYTFDWVIEEVPQTMAHQHSTPGYVGVAASLILLGLFGYFAGSDICRRLKKNKPVSEPACHVNAEVEESSSKPACCRCHDQKGSVPTK